VTAVDYSLPMLRALVRRRSVRSGSDRLRRLRGAGEHLPFRRGTFRAAVAYGNILGFSAKDSAQLLSELARVVRPGGILLLDVASPVAAATEFLSLGAQRRFLLRILRDPDYYFLEGVLAEAERAHQPFAPERMAYWEFDFYTAPAAEAELDRAGFRTVDRMAVGALAAYRDAITNVARRDRRAWGELLRLEELVG